MSQIIEGIILFTSIVVFTIGIYYTSTLIYYDSSMVNTYLFYDNRWISGLLVNVVLYYRGKMINLKTTCLKWVFESLNINWLISKVIVIEGRNKNI